MQVTGILMSEKNIGCNHDLKDNNDLPIIYFQKEIMQDHLVSFKRQE